MNYMTKSKSLIALSLLFATSTAFAMDVVGPVPSVAPALLPKVTQAALIENSNNPTTLGVQKALNTQRGALNSLAKKEAKDFSDLQKRAFALEKTSASHTLRLSALETLTGTHTKEIGVINVSLLTIQDNIAKHKLELDATKDELTKTTAKLEKAIEDGDKAAATELAKVKAKLEGEVETLKGQLTEEKTDRETAVAALKARCDVLDKGVLFNADAIKFNATAIEDLYTQLGRLKEWKDGAQKSIDAVPGQIAKAAHDGFIEAQKYTDIQVETGVKDAKGYAAKVSGEVAAGLATATIRITAVETGLTDLVTSTATDIANAKAAAKKDADAGITALANQVVLDIAAAKKEATTDADANAARAIKTAIDVATKNLTKSIDDLNEVVGDNDKRVTSLCEKLRLDLDAITKSGGTLEQLEKKITDAYKAWVDDVNKTLAKKFHKEIDKAAKELKKNLADSEKATAATQAQMYGMFGTLVSRIKQQELDNARLMSAVMDYITYDETAKTTKADSLRDLKDLYSEFIKGNYRGAKPAGAEDVNYNQVFDDALQSIITDASEHKKAQDAIAEPKATADSIVLKATFLEEHKKKELDPIVKP